MTATGKPRRESAKICLQAIDGITTQEDFDDSSISENIESEASDYVAESENNDVSTDDSDFSSENEADVSGDLKNPSSTSSPTGSVIEEPLPRPLSIKSRRSGLNDKTYLRSPFVRYMRACRGRIDRDPKSIAPVKFQQAIEALKFTFRNIPNPFLCCPSGHKPQFICRQNALFPTSGAWIRTPIHVKKDYLPEPYISPIYLSGQMNRIKLKRFEFDNDSNLVYVGGEVTCLSWCPPRLSSLLESDIIRDECSFLATASILTPDSHTLYSDDMKSGAGTIQIWNCGILGLTKVSSNLKPEIHFIITHDWGRVIDMCWVPVSPFSGIKELKAKACLHGSYMTTIREVERVLGHLIVACQDGFIRVLSIPTCPMNFGCENSAASAFTYTPTKYSYLTLSPSMSENPHWLGWPTCLHIRREFPDRLFAGYTTGYVCCYNLSSLNELVYSPKYNHLAPVKMSRLTNSPVTSISLHPLNGKMLFVQGLERIAGIWDLNDSVCFTSESGEITWKPVHGFMGREAMWISNGEFLVSSRETWFTSAICKTNQYPKWAALFDNMDNCICQFLPSEPNEGCSHLVPLGIQSLTSVDFSDALNAVICSTDRGRIEAVAESVEKRKCDPARPKYIPEMRIPICQWIINKRPPETIHQRIKPEEKYEEVTTVDNEQGDFNKYDYNIIDITSFFDENQFDCIPSTSFSSSPPPTPPPSLANFSITSVDYSNNTTVSAAAVAAPATSPEKMVVKKTDDNVCDGDDDDNVNDEELRQSIFPSPDCEHCELEQSICWHKLWANYELQIMLKDEVPFKPELDFINTPMLKINKIRFNPNPTGATWIAVANSVGFIQFICLEQLYCKQFDIALNRKPTGKDSVYLESKPKEVISKPINNTPKPLRKKSQRRPRTTTTTTSNSKPKLPSSSTSSVQPVQIRIQSVNDNNNNDVTEDRREAISSDLSGDSDATEMMINDMQTLNIIENKNENARNRRRSRRLQSQQSTFNLSNSSTDPCQEP